MARKPNKQETEPLVFHREQMTQGKTKFAIVQKADTAQMSTTSMRNSTTSGGSMDGIVDSTAGEGGNSTEGGKVGQGAEGVTGQEEMYLKTLSDEHFFLKNKLTGRYIEPFDGLKPVSNRRLQL